LLALEVYPIVSLARARQARDDAKRLSANGIDPGAERKRLTQEHDLSSDCGRVFVKAETREVG